MTEITKQQSMDQLLADISLSTAKESLKQEKANTTQIKIQSELYENIAKLNSQTDAIKNVQGAMSICVDMDAHEWVDEPLKRQATLLLKEALKRARLSFK